MLGKLNRRLLGRAGYRWEESIVTCKPIARQRPQHTANSIAAGFSLCPCSLLMRSDVTAALSNHVFSVGPASAAMDWMDSDHVIRVFCRSVPRLYKRRIPKLSSKLPEYSGKLEEYSKQAVSLRSTGSQPVKTLYVQQYSDIGSVRDYCSSCVIHPLPGNG
jgi:hypothetical protein